ncbi:MAG TPA: GNAT family N-acetyltransferase [Bacillales bacterium]|nr:GNAT family N-acetyltransferase [Bacillales bacterium]
MKDIVLSTERMHLRKLHMGDVERLQRIFSDPIAMKHYPSTKNREETVRWIRWNLESYRKFGIGLWSAEWKASGAFAGQVGLVLQEVEGIQEVEIGYLFVREHWGKGLATEGANACKAYGFRELGFERLVSLIAPANERSIRVAKRIGMTFERTVEKWGRRLALYAIRKEDE